MRKYLIIAVSLALAACAGAGPSPPPPSPAPAPRPGLLVLNADWTAPIGAEARCGGDGLSSPFGCDLPPGAKWGVLPADGNQGFGCVDPQPNVCFQPSAGQLGYHAASVGMALVSATTVSRASTISIEAVVTLNSMDCASVGYIGPVIYDGEGAQSDPTGNYFALYLSCPADNGPVQLWLYRPSKAAKLGPWVFATPGTHSLRIDLTPAVSATYYLDGGAIYTETPFSFDYTDPLTFTQDPHPAIWFGASTGAIGRFDVYAGTN